jgi:hypothetical protein
MVSSFLPYSLLLQISLVIVTSTDPASAGSLALPHHQSSSLPPNASISTTGPNTTTTSLPVPSLTPNGTNTSTNTSSPGTTTTPGPSYPSTLSSISTIPISHYTFSPYPSPSQDPLPPVFPATDPSNPPSVCYNYRWLTSLFLEVASISRSMLQTL